MPVHKSAATPAVVDVEGPVRFWLDGELVLFKLTSGDKVICGAISAFDFIETFGRAADVAHQWSSHHYSGNDFRFQSKVSPQTSSDAGRSKASRPPAE